MRMHCHEDSMVNGPTGHDTVIVVYYLDATSAARPRTAALTGLGRAVQSFWADPHHDHEFGRRSAGGLDAAREVVAKYVGARTQDVIVTSSLTQAIDLAVQGMAAARHRAAGDTFIGSAIARTSVLHALEHCGTPSLVSADSSGRLDVDEFCQIFAAHDKVALVAAEVANVEIGTIQPIDPVLTTAAEAGVPVLLDGSVALTRTPLPERWDALVLDAGEWGCGFPLGFLVAGPRLRLRPTWPQDQDAWFPGGISPVWAFTAAVALEDAISNAEAEHARQRDLTDQLRRELAPRKQITVLGNDAQRLPHIVSLAIHGCDGEALARALGRRGYAVGTGSACSSSTIEPNHVLRAMGVDFDGHLRITLDHQSTAEDIAGLGTALETALDEVVND